MDREILFRGKDIFSGEWRYGFYCRTTDDVHYIMSQKPGAAFEYFVVHKKTVGQYTGLKDCEGKSIFGGDILEHAGLLGVIEFRGGIFGLYKTRNGHSVFGQMEKNAGKIIGNIHDNPELLEARK